MDLSKYGQKTQTVFLAGLKNAEKFGHKYVEPEHVLQALLRDKQTQEVLAELGVKSEQIGPNLEVEISKLQRGILKTRGLSSRLVKVATASEAVAARLSSKLIEVPHLLIAMVDLASGDNAASRLLREAGVSKDKLEQSLTVAPSGRVVKKSGKAVDKPDSAFAKYTVDLTAKARNGKIGPIIGRDDEMRRVIQVLSRCTKNNPVLIGKPGVGKTAIIEGLAQRIATGDVPAPLKDKRILTLDLQSMLAGASLRGQFEERMKDIVAEVKAADGGVVLFIDEIHTMVGAGGEGASNASNMLKPVLARGEIQVMGSTTPDEYRKSIEKDKALERRFQAIPVDEPSADETLRVLRGIKNRFEVHHGVRIQDTALSEAVSLSRRYMPSRNLPDKAIDLIDEAASRMKIEIDSVPSVLDSKERTLTHMKMELHALTAETDGVVVATKGQLEQRIAALETEVVEIRTKWENEVRLIQTIRATKEERTAVVKELEAAERDGALELATELKYGALKQLDDRLAAANEELNVAQKVGRLIKEEVEGEDIARVVADITGIPVATMMEGEKQKLLKMEDRIGERVIGQREALHAIAKAVRRSRGGLNDPNRPVGSFFFLGPTGVGKTELAKALASFLFNDEGAMIRLDMSEFQEKHTVARLIGAPPGYKGADEGGQLTEAVRAKPYSVVLFDEVEKAHPDLFNILLQVLDDGRLTDSQGRLVDFKNTVIIMTSNVGSNFLLESTLEHGHITKEAEDQALGVLRQKFRPEFLGRIDEVITFHGLTKDNIEKIAEIHLRKIGKMLAEKKLKFEVAEDARAYLVEAGYEPAYGARPLRRALQRLVQDPLSAELLGDKFASGDTVQVRLTDGALNFEAKK